MQLKEALRTLKSKGTAQNRKVYARHGYPEDTYGVGFADLRALAEKVGSDHDLALALWDTGNGDAMLLATMVADPERMTLGQCEKWVKQVGFYVLADQLASLVARTPHARRKSDQWRGRKSDFVAQVGWSLVSLQAATQDADLAWLESLLPTIEEEIHDVGDRARHAMNMALCSIGGYHAELTGKARAVAKRVGRVEVDHGKTGCKTPPAGPYIEKMAARYASKGKLPGPRRC